MLFLFHDQDGKTCLNTSLWRGHATVASMLIFKGANVNLADQVRAGSFVVASISCDVALSFKKFFMERRFFSRLHIQDCFYPAIFMWSSSITSLCCCVLLHCQVLNRTSLNFICWLIQARIEFGQMWLTGFLSIWQELDIAWEVIFPRFVLFGFKPHCL